jgi:hypothetical protein
LANVGDRLTEGTAALCPETRSPVCEFVQRHEWSRLPVRVAWSQNEVVGSRYEIGMVENGAEVAPRGRRVDD